MVERRYQVFISSTFRDLATERQAVLLAVQRLNHIPVGMELFPSANDAPWDVIERIINSSDYYVLIIGGRYGSMDENGISFTEREFDLAASRKIPVLAFLHAEPEKLAVEVSDIDAIVRLKLEAFRSKVEQTHHCTYWRNADELAGKVVIGLVNEIAQNPRAGWVPGNLADDRQTLLSTIEAVRRENDTLRLRNEQLAATIADSDASELICQGNDTVVVKLSRQADDSTDVVIDNIETTWHKLFMSIAWDAASGATESTLRHTLAKEYGDTYYMDDDTWRQIATQFLALDLLIVRQEMRPTSNWMNRLGFGGETGSPRDVPTDIWQLTEKGRRLFAQVNAVKRSN